MNCLHPSENCFCNSTGTGPGAREGIDLAVAELGHSLMIEAGIIEGEKVPEQLPCEEVRVVDFDEKTTAISRCRKIIKKIDEDRGSYQANL